MRILEKAHLQQTTTASPMMCEEQRKFDSWLKMRGEIWS